ncbi:MAG: hypothetical protein BIFFINMI_01957 [Phycisphaerae bacterium]|nr:hypothetical protein [Phycisphaerae bacterium]
MTRYDKAQEKMLSALDAVRDLGCGGKCNGDACCRILRSFLGKEIGSRLKISPPNAFIAGCRREFDLLVVDKESQPFSRTNAFPAKDVRCAIEVKAVGVAFSKNPEEDVRKLRKHFEVVQASYPEIRQALFIFEESSPRHRTGTDYWQITHSKMKPFRAFCLRNRRGKRVHAGEWKEFTKFIRSACSRRS